MASQDPITPELIPPIDPSTGELAEPTGEMFRDSSGDAHIVYRASFYDPNATYDPANRRKVLDPKTEKQVTRKNDDGTNYGVWQFPIVFTKQEFILERSSIGEVAVSHHFRPSEAEVAQRVKEQQADVFQQSLADLAAARGITAEDLLNQLVADTPESPASPVDPALPHLVMLTPGWWNVVVDGENMSEKNLRKPAAEELQAELVKALGNPEPDGSY